MKRVKIYKKTTKPFAPYTRTAAAAAAYKSIFFFLS
jgi:hypothetical protein